MKILNLLALSVLLLLVAGCAKTAPQPDAPAAPAEPQVEPVPTEPATVEPVSKPAGGSAEVQILGRAGFEPSEIKISTGTTVTWRVSDTTTHRLIQVGTGVSSPLLKPGATYEYTFNQPGKFEVLDVVFKGKSLMVIVE
ncbi:hypothetical protein HY638_00650 [Candidatus Woesearchaeota archaeon]|nr:hypothetical protein [Candidatus Woesearchaeota archaeon]